MASRYDIIYRYKGLNWLSSTVHLHLVYDLHVCFSIKIIYIKGTDESSLRVDSFIAWMHQDMSTLASQILIQIILKEHTVSTEKKTYCKCLNSNMRNSVVYSFHYWTQCIFGSKKHSITVNEHGMDSQDSLNLRTFTQKCSTC